MASDDPVPGAAAGATEEHRQRIPAATIEIQNASVTVPSRWNEIALPEDLRSAYRDLHGAGSRDVFFSTRSNASDPRALKPGDLPLLAISSWPLSNDLGTFSADPAEYERQIQDIVDQATAISGRQQKPARRTLLGDARAVAYEADRIWAPGAEGTGALSLNIGAVHDGHQYSVSMFVAPHDDEAQARAEIGAIASSWRWR